MEQHLLFVKWLLWRYENPK